jgi:two-component system, OmpR family, phosphate regulon sensor histidine kinase PhoR
MKRQKYTISQKITVLNETILDSMTEKDANAIVKNFTESSIKILDADFGFAWWKFGDSEEYQLAYKSQGTPYEPFMPRKKANHYMAIKRKKPIFDSDVKGKNYGTSDISPYMRSFVIIPIYHKKHIYGSITLCYKKKHNFSEEELTLSQSIGNTTAQAITIHRLVQTDILLAQERLKTEFIGNATHELGTPLAIMRGRVDLALMKKTDPFRALREINLEIKILSEILKDLVLLTSPNPNISQILNPTPVNVTGMINTLAKRLKTVAREKKIQIKIENGSIEDVYVSGDDKTLEKLFINLLKNAISYGKRGGKIIIDINKTPKVIRVKISDDGIGISKQDLPKIFERFYRGDKAHTHNQGNHSGLGLAIVRWAAELHGGTVSAKSVVGKGSVFTVTLPILREQV